MEPATVQALVQRLGGAAKVWAGGASAWQSVCRIRDGTARRLERWIRECDPCRVEQRLGAQGIWCLVQGDSRYPECLWDLTQPPLVLFAKGTLPDFANAVGVVGTRRPSSYGLEATRWIAETLASRDCHIVSGLAEGIDGEAHRSALTVGGRTTAVLACGVDVCYPAKHYHLYEEIIRSEGLLLSEYPPGDGIAKHRFPQRNRIIAALSRALVVVQAGEKSGALHTADAALDLGRDVYAVPGPITSVLYRGSNRLLQQGAQILLDPLDFLLEQGVSAAKLPPAQTVPDRWQDIYECLVEPQAPAAIAAQIARPLSHVFAGLLERELAGLVERRSGGAFARKGTNRLHPGALSRPNGSHPC
jgi:DNA processing protein